MSYDQPSAPVAFKAAEHIGDGVLVAVHNYETGIPTTFGTKDAVRADVVVVTGNDAGSRYTDTLIFGMKLVGQLKASVGRVVLGKVARGQAKPGQQAPYQLDAAGDAEVKGADAWIAANGELTAHDPAPSRPAPQMAAEAPAPVATASSARPVAAGGTYTDEPPF